MDSCTMDMVDIQKDIKRCIVNREIMMMYGHDTTGYLPPLPIQERPLNSIAAVWSCKNPAMRQLSIVSRRGHRAPLPGAAAQSAPSGGPGSLVASVTVSTQPGTVMSEVNARSRPHTAYTAYIRSVLNRRVCDLSRPGTSHDLSKSMTPRRGTDNDLDRLIFPSQMALRADNAMSEDDFPDFSTVDTNTSGRLKSSRIMRNNYHRKKHGMEKKKKTVNMDSKREVDIMKVLKGDFETVPAEPSTAIRLYICACSVDMQEERRALQHHVYPELRVHCARLGLDFHVVDLRGGADSPTDQDYATSGVYTHQVAGCQQLSLGPAFLMIIGDKYGPAPLPAHIVADEFEIMKKMAEEERLPKYFLMDAWYVRDNNATPPVYVLQPRAVEVKGLHGRRRKDQQIPFTDKRARQLVYTHIQQIMQEAISVSIEEGKLISQERKHKYFKASSEEEVLEGVLHCKSTADKCLCYIREFSDLPHNANNEISMKYTDMMMRDGQVKPDAQARKFLQAMKSNVTGKLEETNNLRFYEPSLVEYLGHTPRGNPAEKPTYIEQFVSDVTADLKGLTDRAKEMLDASSNVKHFAMYKQVLPHASWVKEITRYFIGREDFFQAVKDYLKDTERCCRPLVIQGAAGYGKTCCMAMLAKKAKDWFGSTSVIVLRFISETLHTADIKTVLHDICNQMSVVYNMDPIPKESMENIYRVGAVFRAYLEQVSKWHAEKKPLVVLLDGLDQLSIRHRAQSMQWLPTHCPPNVYLIVSTETSCTTLNKCLQQRLPNSDCFMDLGEVDGNTVELMVNTALEQAKRTLQPEQRDFLLRNGKTNPHPIYLALTIKEALTWCSYTKIDEDYVPTTAEDAISRVLDRLETKYGLKLVRDLVSYLVMVQTGLTETELTDVLSCNDEVLQDVFIQHDLPLDNTVVMPSFLIASLLDDLQVFLVRRNKDNKTVLAWRNRTYRALCAKKYFGVTDPLHHPSEESQHYCHDLAEVFLQEAGIHKQFEHPMTYTVIEKADRQVTPQVLSKDNLRKLKLLPSFIIQSGRTAEVLEDLKVNCFCNFNWLMAKLEGLGIDAMIEELEMIEVHDNDLFLMRDLMRIAYNGLKSDPMTLASHMLGMVPHISAAMYPGVARVVSESRCWTELADLPLVVPALPCLPSPLDACKQKLWGVVEVLGLDREEQVGVMKTVDNVIEFWDLECAEMIVSTGLQYDRIEPNVYCSQSLVAIYTSDTLLIWDIQTCTVEHSIALDKLLGERLSTTLHMHHTDDFATVVLQSADENFNQTVSVVDTAQQQVTHRIPNFDVNDEFYRDSAVLLSSEQQLWFISARSRSAETGRTWDDVTLSIYCLENSVYLRQIPLGHRKFSKLLLSLETAVVCWADASFEEYNLNSGERVGEFTAPDRNLTMKMCELTSGNSLFFLVTTEATADITSLYSALWCWNMKEHQLSQFCIKTHQTREEVFDKFILYEMESYAVLTSPGSATIWLWDLQNHKPIRSILAHTMDVTYLHPMTSSPFSLFTGSSSEGVVKQWQLYQAVAAGPNATACCQSRIPSAPGDGILKRQGSRYKPRIVVGWEKEAHPGPAIFYILIWIKDYPKILWILARDYPRLVPQENNSYPSSVPRHKLGSGKSGKSVRFVDGYGDDTASTVTSRPGSVFDDRPSGSANANVICQHDSAERAMLNVCSVAFSRNGRHVVTGYEESPPVLWDACVGQMVHKMALQTASDVGTLWVSFASKDRYVVGLTKTKKTVKGAPPAYMFQVWNKDTAQVVCFPAAIFACTCTLALDHEKVLLSSVEGWEANGQTHDLVFRILNLTGQEVIHTVTYNTTVIPTTLELTEDHKCAVTNNIAPDHDPSEDIAMFTIDSAETNPNVMFYKFRKGKKFPEYRVTQNYVMKNGLAMAVGLNGDMQIWDIPSCEYEGNLSEDPTVKNTQSPGLHTHGGLAILQLAISADGRYLVAGSADCTASLWDLESETRVHRYTGHTGKVTAVAISNDNQLVLTAGEDCNLCVWRLGAAPGPLCHLPVYLPPHTLLISPDNRAVVALGNGRGELTKLLLFRLRNVARVGATREEQRELAELSEQQPQSCGEPAGAAPTERPCAVPQPPKQPATQNQPQP